MCVKWGHYIENENGGAAGGPAAGGRDFFFPVVGVWRRASGGGRASLAFMNIELVLHSFHHRPQYTAVQGFTITRTVGF